MVLDMKIIRFILDIRKILKPQLRLASFQREWRNNNKHNYTRAGCVFPAEKVRVGNLSYGTLNVVSYGNPNESLEVGNCCSIAGETKFILSGEHDYRRFSTYPFSTMALKHEPESISKGAIIIEDDVWIGYGCIILSGVKIGRGAVIGAGSVVVRDIPPYSVYAGNRIIKKRFSDEIIEKLLLYPFPVMSVEDIEKKLPLLESHLTTENLDLIMEIEKSSLQR